MTRIHFFLRFYTTPGQSLSVLGNTEALGNGDPNKAVPLSFLNSNFWHGTITVPKDVDRFNYHYILTYADGYKVFEFTRGKEIRLSKLSFDDVHLIDTWSHPGEYENVFYTDPFQQILLNENQTRFKIKQSKTFTHIFKVKAPLLKKNEIVCLLGSGTLLHDWQTDTPILLSREDEWWSVRLNLPKEIFPITYKYGVYNSKEERFIRYEEGENRIIHGDASDKKQTIVHDGFVHLPNNTWKGAGISVPVFSLRTKNSFGIGEFSDIPFLVDWSLKLGLKLVQILPVNDTSATHTWHDTYPYASISAFALHPIYVNLEKVAGRKCADLIRPLRKKQKQLNELSQVDYEEVLNLKLATLKELYAVQKEDFFKDEESVEFFNRNKHWLIPYAAFCYLRDRNGTSDFNKWKLYSEYDKKGIEKYVSPKAKHFDSIALHYFIQFHLHKQLKEAAEYAHKNGIILKGDIPIGIYRFGCDAWLQPKLYHMNFQAGAPPDDFAVRGQNWEFPTYNWEEMAKDHFEWWHERFVHMSNYFDAFRIDHILGFFRIWSIPVHSVEGIMGYFVPCLPVHIHEFGQNGIWFDYDRYCKPHITEAVLWELFGPNKEKFKSFLQPNNRHGYDLRESFSTQRQVDDHFKSLEQTEDNKNIRQGLLDLISNVILFEHPGSFGQEFHFRISMEKTTSFRHLEWNTQQQLRELYINYFYRRQDHFWRREGMKKLPPLKRSTNMLVCGEDLGMVPSCVPEVMSQLGILSLEIQRMPKDPSREFFHPADAPYLSVVTPSTHDMSTIRGWWEEDRERTQRFFNNEMGEWGEAPKTCEAWINKSIVLQHLHSPAMWSIFQLQDLLGMSDSLRRENPHEERINVPANAKHLWNYRMHLNLDDLVREKDFNDEIRSYVEASGRE